MCEKAKKTKYGDKQPVSVAIKPGTYMEYLWNHPEEVRRILLEHGADPDEEVPIGVFTKRVINIGKKNLQPKKDSRSESLHSGEGNGNL